MLLEDELASLVIAVVGLLGCSWEVVELHGGHHLAVLPEDVGLQDAADVVLVLCAVLLAIGILYELPLNAVLVVLAGQPLTLSLIIVAGALCFPILIVLSVLTV